jgi:protocatechuate 3,4-dioxygenase beta subunit
MVFGVAVLMVILAMVLSEKKSDIQPRLERFSESRPQIQIETEDTPRIEPPVGSESLPQREKMPAVEIDDSSELSFDMIRGRVVDEAGTLIAGAQLKARRVWVEGEFLASDTQPLLETVTDASGRFFFDPLPEGQYSVVATLGDKAGFIRPLLGERPSANEGFPCTHEIVLETSGTISGRVVDPEGRPLPGVCVYPYWAGLIQVDTDPEGRFNLSPLEDKTYKIRFSANGFTQQAVKAAAGTQDLEVMLGPGGSISGTVRYEGKPMPGILVSARGNDSLCAERVTDGHGRYLLPHLREDHYTVEAEGDRFSSAPLEQLKLLDGDHREGIDFSLDRHGSISGRVASMQTDEPLAGIWMQAYTRGDRFKGPKFFYEQTDSEGRYRFASLPPERYFVAVRRADNFIRKTWNDEEKVELMPGQQIEGIDFRLEEGATRIVRVSAASGDPICGADVSIYRKGRNEGLYRPEQLTCGIEELGRGRYKLQGLAAGSYSLRIFRRGWIRIMQVVNIAESDKYGNLDFVMEPTLHVTCKVEDPHGNVIPQAWIEIRNEQGITDADGLAEFYDVSPGHEYVQIHAEGHQSYFGSVDITKESRSLSFTLLPEGNYFLAGRVVDDLGNPVPEAKIKAYQNRKSANQIRKSTVSKADGTFRIDGLVNGKVEMSVDSDVGVLKEDKMLVDPGRSDLTLVLERFGRIKGTLTDAHGDPVLRFKVWAGNPAYGKRHSYDQATDGTFDCAKVFPGEVYISVRTKSGIEMQSDVLKIGPGEVIENFELTLPAMGSISGTVRAAATGSPVPGANVKAVKGGRSYKSESKEDGSFVISDLYPGDYRLNAGHRDYVLMERLEIQVPEGGQVAGIDLLLKRACSIRGRVFVAGRPRKGVSVQLDQTYDRGDGKITEVDGSYLLEGVHPGEHSVAAFMSTQRKNRAELFYKLVLNEGEARELDLHFGDCMLAGKVYVFGEPEEDVKIKVRPLNIEPESVYEVRAEAKTATGGAFIAEHLLPGDYRVSARFFNDQGHWSVNEEVTLTGNVQTIVLNIGQAGDCEIFGHVYENNQPLPGVLIHADHLDNNNSWRATSDSSGFYRFTAVPAGEVFLTAVTLSKGMQNPIKWQMQLSIAEKETLQQDIHFETGTGVIAGKATLNGKPVELGGIHASSQSSLAPPVDGVITGGEFRLENLAPGRYEVKIMSQQSFVTRTVEVFNGQETQMDIELGGEPNIEGRIKIPPQTSYKQFVVVLFKPGKCPWKPGVDVSRQGYQDFVGISEVDGDGSFHLSQIEPDTYDLIAVFIENPNIIGKLQSQPITIQGQEKIHVEITFDP